MNLAGNCSKHILAELKHAHVDGVERACKKKDGCGSSTNAIDVLDPIPPPSWNPSLLNTAFQSLADYTDTGNGSSDSDRDFAAADHERQSILALVDREVEALDRKAPRNSRMGMSSAEHCSQAVCRVAETHGDRGAHRPKKKAPRGNACFFVHMASVQSTLEPQRKDESTSDLRKRVADAAKETWGTAATSPFAWQPNVFNPSVFSFNF